MLSLKSVGFSTSRLHTVHIVLSDNGCDKCICSLSESSNVISVVSKAQWKSFILKCMKKPEKLTFAINIMESAWLLYFAGLSLFHGEEYIYWPAVVSNLVPSPTFFCENTETLACLSFSRPPPDPATHSPLPLPPTPITTTTTPLWSTSPGARKDVYKCLHFLSVWEVQNSPPALLTRFPSGVCVKCTLPWFFFYTILCNLPL